MKSSNGFKSIEERLESDVSLRTFGLWFLLARFSLGLVCYNGEKIQVQPLTYDFYEIVLIVFRLENRLSTLWLAGRIVRFSLSLSTFPSFWYHLNWFLRVCEIGARNGHGAIRREKKVVELMHLHKSSAMKYKMWMRVCKMCAAVHVHSVYALNCPLAAVRWVKWQSINIH